MYFEVFESWDDDDDRGVTAGDTYLGVDALVNGTVTFWVVPSPATTLIAGAPLYLRLGRRNRRG